MATEQEQPKTRTITISKSRPPLPPLPPKQILLNNVDPQWLLEKERERLRLKREANRRYYDRNREKVITRVKNNYHAKREQEPQPIVISS